MSKRVLRNPALERRIVEAPDDPAPRLVYGDWLQTQGDPLGEWIAMSATREASAHLAAHAEALLGRPGKAVLDGGWIGWRGGFIDELRLQAPLPDALRRVRALLALPIARFVRRITIGRLAHVTELVDEIVAAAPPLLADLLVGDGAPSDRGMEHGPLEALAALPSLRRLGLFGANVAAKLPQLRELAIAVPSTTSPWVASGGCENVEVLTVDCRTTPAPLEPLVAAMPRLRRVHVVGTNDRELVERQLAGLSLDIARVHEDWVAEQVLAYGRDAVALVPFAGVHLCNAGGKLLARERAGDAARVLDAAITLPNPSVSRLALNYAALARLACGRWDDAIALVEDVLRRVQEPVLHGVRIDALRRAGRVEDAVARVPAAVAAIASRGGTFDRGVPICEAACLTALAAAAGRDAELLALAERFGTAANPAAELVARARERARR